MFDVLRSTASGRMMQSRPSFQLTEWSLVKLAIINDEISQDLLVALEVVGSHEFHGIEIRSVWNTRPHELSGDQCRRIRDELDAADVELVAYDSPVFKHALPETTNEQDAAARLFERSIEIAHALGNPPTRIFSFYRDGWPCVYAAAEAMAKLLDRVPCHDVPLLVENGTRTNSPTASTLVELLDMLAPRELGALWDPGNAMFCGLERTPPLDALQMLDSRLRLVHVKDPSGSDHYTKLGDGDVQWAVILDKLVADGFAGSLSLETHWRLNRTLKRAERDEPWGDAFSCDGRVPSSICMAVLKSMATIASDPQARRD
jgi:sugar phosphate isomerase/epimerase